MMICSVKSKVTTQWFLSSFRQMFSREQLILKMKNQNGFIPISTMTKFGVKNFVVWEKRPEAESVTYLGRGIEERVEQRISFHQKKSFPVTSNWEISLKNSNFLFWIEFLLLCVFCNLWPHIIVSKDIGGYYRLCKKENWKKRKCFSTF